MEYAGDVTRQDVKDSVEAIIEPKVWNAAMRANCQLNVSVDRNMNPKLTLTSDLESITIDIETRDIYNDDDELECQVFTPKITLYASEADFNEEDPVDITMMFTTWTDIAELCKMINEIEYYPSAFFD